MLIDIVMKQLIQKNMIAKDKIFEVDGNDNLKSKENLKKILEEVAKVKSKLIEALYDSVKFSPLLNPEFYEKSHYVQTEKTNHDILNFLQNFQTNDMKKNIRYRLNLKSIYFLIQEIFQRYFSQDIILMNCFGNNSKFTTAKCPQIIQDTLNFASVNSKENLDFKNFLNISLNYMQFDEQKFLKDLKELINQMFLFAYYKKFDFQDKSQSNDLKTGIFEYIKNFNDQINSRVSRVKLKNRKLSSLI